MHSMEHKSLASIFDDHQEEDSREPEGKQLKLFWC